MRILINVRYRTPRKEDNNMEKIEKMLEEVRTRNNEKNM